MKILSLKIENRSHLTDLAGYRIYYGYYGTSSQFHLEIADVGNLSKYTLHHLMPGTYDLAVTAYDTSGNEIDFSNEIIKTVP